MFALKRAYEKAGPEDGTRFLVERLWPRGVRDCHPEAWDQIRSAGRHGQVTLIYSVHDTEPNNAVALQEYLETHMSQKKGTSHA